MDCKNSSIFQNFFIIFFIVANLNPTTKKYFKLFYFSGGYKYIYSLMKR